MVLILNLAKSEKEALAILGDVKKVVSLLKLIVMYSHSDGISGIELFKKIKKKHFETNFIVFIEHKSSKVETDNFNIAVYIRKHKDGARMNKLFLVLQNYWNINEFIKIKYGRSIKNIVY